MQWGAVSRSVALGCFSTGLRGGRRVIHGSFLVRAGRPPLRGRQRARFLIV